MPSAYCSICLTAMVNMYVTLPCGHRFHGMCINDWTATGNNSCPLCRRVVHSDSSRASFLDTIRAFERDIDGLKALLMVVDDPAQMDHVCADLHTTVAMKKTTEILYHHLFSGQSP